MSTTFFSLRQRRIISVALTFFAVMAILGCALLSIGVVSFIANFFKMVIWPLAIAGVLSVLLKPLVDGLERFVRLPNALAIVLLYAVLLGTLVGLLTYILPAFFQQVVNFIYYLPQLVSNFMSYAQTHFPSVLDFLQGHIEAPGQDAAKLHTNELVNTLKTTLSSLIPKLQFILERISALFGWSAAFAVLPIYLFFLLRTKNDFLESLNHELSFMNAKWRGDLVFLMREFRNIIVAFFRGQLLIGLLMGILYTLGFSFIGLEFALMLGFSLGLLNIVPYLGTILGLTITLPIAYFQPEGGLHLLLYTSLVFCAVQCIEGYFLTPKIMGKQTGLHPMTIIVAIFFWGTVLDGVLGMILAIPLTAFLVVAWRLLKTKYLGESVA